MLITPLQITAMEQTMVGAQSQETVVMPCFVATLRLLLLLWALVDARLNAVMLVATMISSPPIALGLSCPPEISPFQSMTACSTNDMRAQHRRRLPVVVPKASLPSYLHTVFSLCNGACNLGSFHLEGHEGAVSCEVLNGIAGA